MYRGLVIFSLSLIVVLSVFPLSNHPMSLPAAHGAPASTVPTIAIQGEFYASSNIVDPSLVPGTSLNVTVEGLSLPRIIDTTNGGIQGFDITISYNSSLLRPELSSINGPFCDVGDDCLWGNLSPRQFLTFANQVNASAGTFRYGVLVYNQAYRPPTNGTLFKIGFQVIGLGTTSITVDPMSSFLIGYSQRCGIAITNYAIQNGYFDNRRPWTVTANPSTTSMLPGATAHVDLTVSWVNSPDGTDVTMILPSGTGNLTLLIPPGGFSFSPLTGRLDPSVGLLSFTSVLTLNSSSTAPQGRYIVPIIAHESNSFNPFLQYTLNYTVIVDPPGPFVVFDQKVDGSTPNGTSTVAYPSSSSFDPLLPLVANFTFAASTLSVTFAAIACGGTLPFTYTWDFGNGATGAGSAVVYGYSNPGNYIVTLKVVDAAGRVFVAKQTVSVSAESSFLLDASLVGLGLLATLLIGAIFLRRRR